MTAPVSSAFEAGQIVDVPTPHSLRLMTLGAGMGTLRVGAMSVVGINDDGWSPNVRPAAWMNASSGR